VLEDDLGGMMGEDGGLGGSRESRFKPSRDDTKRSTRNDESGNMTCGGERKRLKKGGI